MPTVLRAFGYRLFFHSRDIGEPPHVHVERGGAHCKIWLEPVRVAQSFGLRGSELSRVLRIVQNQRRYLLERWHEHFSR